MVEPEKETKIVVSCELLLQSADLDLDLPGSLEGVVGGSGVLKGSKVTPLAKLGDSVTMRLGVAWRAGCLGSLEIRRQS